MKKLYALMAALLIVSFSFGQIETKNYRLENLKLGEKPAQQTQY